MSKPTKNQYARIADNLRAFRYNFGSVRIEREDAGRGFYVYFPKDSDSYIQYCPDINYLDGWLYGAVQGFLRSEFKKAHAGSYAVTGRNAHV